MSTNPDRLEDYRRKRDFEKTSEPAGEGATSGGAGFSFLVQKHDARRLHYDLRLEWEGVLLSWAVTRGPSLDPREKRLAVKTEDHPLSYGDFEGTIPKDEYGGGTVMLWDRGLWEPVHDPADGLEQGKLHFRLHGERMQGGWALVRMRGKEKRENWLLIKERDEVAADSPDKLTRRYSKSVKTGRSMAQIEKGVEGEAAPDSARRQTGKLPGFRPLQLATLVDRAPDGDGWWHETKFDGYRCLVALGRGGPRFYTRSGKDWTEKFRGLVAPFASLACDHALIDGEIMARTIKGSAFSALQTAIKEQKPLVFYAFDLLYLDGDDLQGAPLQTRRERLEDLFKGLSAKGSLRLTEYVIGHGPEIYQAACREGAEGIIAKRIDAPYRKTRSKDWRKVKCTRRREFVVGGYAKSDKKGRSFASLLLGEFDGDKLHYRGRVGTGFGERDFDELSVAMEPRKTSPFKSLPDVVARNAVWVKPALIAEIEFTELTADGRIRHGSYLGLREDKSAKEVAMNHDSQRSQRTQPAGVEISSPDREVFPSIGVTKLELAEYYAAAGERMAEIIRDYPLSLVRCPEGLGQNCFYQKHPGKGFPDELPRVEIEEKEGQHARYLYINNARAIVSAVQMGGIEFHIWGARRDRLDRPDRMVFDLDPDDSLAFGVVRDAAFELREWLDALGLGAGVMVTGGKGIHVWVPLRRTRSWDTVKLFAKTLAYTMADRAPQNYVAQMAKQKREGKVFIDWLRNERGSTAIAPYSVRARRGAPVARPVTWEELEMIESADQYSLATSEQWWPEICPFLDQAQNLQSITNDTIVALEKRAKA